MQHMMSIFLALAAIAPPALVQGQKGPAAGDKKTCVVVFDFACAQGDYGKQISDSIRLRLRRHKEYFVVDRLTTQETAGPTGVDVDRKKIIKIMNEQLAVTVALYGTVTKTGETFFAEVSGVDLSKPGEPVFWTENFSDNTQRARSQIARKTVEALRNQADWTPPEYGDEEEPDSKQWSKPLNVNGGFEDGHKGWAPPDLVSTFLVKAKDAEGLGRGTILTVRTDLERDAWLAYRRKLRLGQTDPSKAPKIARDTGYNSVAGLEGVHYRSSWIKATPGQRYWLVADMKGKTSGMFFAKVFVKGFLNWGTRAEGLPESSLSQLGLTPRQFADLPREKQQQLIAADTQRHPHRYRRECYRWYLSCRNKESTWKHFAAPFPPRGGLPKHVQWLQIQIYSYWPPGEYLWDDVHLYKDPRQAAPLAEEKARTPRYRPIASQPAPVAQPHK